MKSLTTKKRMPNTRRAALHRQIEAIGDAYGRFDWLLIDFDDAELETSLAFDRTAFPLIERMILDRAGKTGMKHFIAGNAVGLGLKRPDPKRLVYHGPLSELLQKIWSKALKPARSPK